MNMIRAYLDKETGESKGDRSTLIIEAINAVEDGKTPLNKKRVADLLKRLYNLNQKN